MIAGIAIVMICFFVQGIYCFLSALGVIAILLVTDVFYTYKIAHFRQHPVCRNPLFTGFVGFPCPYLPGKGKL